ncbi:hypothetical protein [Bacillus wiedmannii]|uniref:hypothetical protein n=1 Tax=Bacillus wiedmannii TaxID=1890302 RepID=UPI000BF1ABF5|nr:hypothetical protein [Bacillus wiedmannii]PEM08553.1 hypothetical protein CN610_20080 [Bacillus wiedmannii]
MKRLCVAAASVLLLIGCEETPERVVADATVLETPECPEKAYKRDRELVYELNGAKGKGYLNEASCVRVNKGDTVSFKQHPNNYVYDFKVKGIDY